MRGEDQEIEYFAQLKGSVLPYSFDFRDFNTAAGLTFDTATASISDSSVMDISDELANAGIWTANLGANQVGCVMVTVTATYTGSSVTRVRKFQVQVTDPDCHPTSTRDYT